MKARYWGGRGFGQERSARAGVLLLNLGTPAAPTARALRRYLAEFLNDPRVVELAPPLRRLLVHGVVLRLRPRISAAAYRSIWMPQGSPLMVHSRALEAALRGVLEARSADPVPLALAMRYGEPRISTALRTLVRAGVERLLVLPLYPQYSGATVGSAFDAVAAALSRLRWVPELRFVNHYHDDARYIAALAASIEAHWRVHGRTERLLFSFHGMPRATSEAGDPYHDQCLAAARLLAESLALSDAEWEVGFQSRFGRAEWLAPATDAVLSAWAGAGVASATVVCPGFAVDCLETLEEVDGRYRRAFLAAGGQRFEYVPALNADPDHVEALAGIVADGMSGWPEAERGG